ncbi:MAG: hypothetical protein IKM18_10290 [Clostridia bacterium]|nr:hypothetical protein [Clostridia bacterium]
MFGRFWRSFMEGMGLITILFTALSLIFPNKIEFRELHLAVCIYVSVHIFSFLTFELKLFSKHLWIRRTIVVFVSLLIVSAFEFIFGYFRFELDYLIVWGSVMLLTVVFVFFVYYVGDKIEQHNLKLINQKLCEKNENNVE